MEYQGYQLVCGVIRQRMEISLARFASLVLSVSALNSYRMVTAWGEGCQEVCARRRGGVRPFGPPEGGTPYGALGLGSYTGRGAGWGAGGAGARVRGSYRQAVLVW